MYLSANLTNINPNNYFSLTVKFLNQYILLNSDTYILKTNSTLYARYFPFNQTIIDTIFVTRSLVNKKQSFEDSINIFKMVSKFNTPETFYSFYNLANKQNLDIGPNTDPDPQPTLTLQI